MDRFTATRLALRISVLLVSITPAQGQVQVGDLVVTPEPDGVTVRLAQQDSAPREIGILPARRDEGSEADAGADSVDTVDSVQASAPLSYQPAHAPITRITLSSDDLPPPAAYARPLPPLPAPRAHAMERDVQTLKAAYAAMQLEDAMRDRKIASLR